MQAYTNISLEQRSSMPPNQTMRSARRSIAEQNTLQALAELRLQLLNRTQIFSIDSSPATL
jgi:hypothetical protein